MVRFPWMNCGAMTLISTLITCRGPGSCIPFCTGCPKGAPDPCFHNISISITSIHFVAKVNFSKYTVVVSLYITWLANVCDFASLRDNLFSCYPREFASFRGKSILSDTISVLNLNKFVLLFLPIHPITAKWTWYSYWHYICIVI